MSDLGGGLPTVPPGTNPWTVYIATLESSLFKQPPPAFKSRLIALIAITALTAVLAAIYLIVLLKDAWSKRQDTGKRKGLWLFRLAQRANGSYIITNTRLTMAVLTLINVVVEFGYFQDVWSVSFAQGNQRQSASWRNLAFIPLFIHGWIVTWGSLQAFLLTTDHHHRQILSPRITNVLFVGVGMILFLACIGVAIANIIMQNRLLDNFDALTSQMRTFERSWQPSDNTFVQLAGLSGQFNKVISSAADTRRYNIIQLSVMSLVPIIVLFICINSLRLALVIRQQIVFNIEQCRRPMCDTTMTMHTIAGGAKDEGSKSAADLAKEFHRPSIVSFVNINRQHLSRSEMRQLARRGSGPEDRERLRHIQALQKAENDLIVINSLLLLAIGAITGICLFAIAAVAKHTTLESLAFNQYETLMLGAEWVYAIAVCAVLAGLLYNVWSSRSLTTSKGDGSSGFFSSMSMSNPIASFHRGEMATVESVMQTHSPQITGNSDSEWRTRTNSFFRVDVQVDRSTDGDEKSSKEALSPGLEKVCSRIDEEHTV
ncbi:hypothetical protein OIO90_003664 [Microbotryomycetes sp. JL221]|nr:hypothetical protein OIO90_003664 [Microbotryomycetes sp. JL221]